MEKYLGNKSSILPLIDAFLQSRVPGVNSISDVFAGTNNVSRYFRGRGWATAACDANRFSYVLAQAYLGTVVPPLFEGVRKGNVDALRLRRLELEFARGISRYGELYLPGSDTEQMLQDMRYLSQALLQLQTAGERNLQPGVITEHFTQWGTRSKYSSIRGTSGVRNYFSKNNALFLDAVLDSVRQWWRAGLLQRAEVFLLLTSIIEEVVITANVNGTFHDFNRDRIWPNATQQFQLRLPLVSHTGPSAEIANADAVEAAGVFGHHSICYLDPPYNFRQYTAYYHFLNFVAAYPFLDEIGDYVMGLSHVRGQHPEDDFSSDFCYQNRFVSSLKRLIGNVDADHVVLSYYSGRNHWNHWSSVSEPTDEGFREIRALFDDKELFSQSEVVPALDVRRNYQSRVGEQKKLVNEYLFHGVRRTRPREARTPKLGALLSNERWGLTREFSHTVPILQHEVDHLLRATG
jgi:adenine-specific DNA-methyltransferase